MTHPLFVFLQAQFYSKSNWDIFLSLKVPNKQTTILKSENFQYKFWQALSNWEFELNSEDPDETAHYKPPYLCLFAVCKFNFFHF